jgi:hypothetical protein
VEEESHIDGNHQTLPLRIRQLKVRKITYVSRHTPVFGVCFATEKNRASLTGTNHLACGRLDQMFMLGKQLGATHLAALHDGARPNEPSQNGKRRRRIADSRFSIADLGIIVRV